MNVTRDPVGNLQGELATKDLLRISECSRVNRKKYEAALKAADDLLHTSPEKDYASLQDSSDTGKLGKLFLYLKTGSIYAVLFCGYLENMV